MNLRDKKGSISIFVLVALLFMASVLLLMFASSVNKSKVVKEQFNTISGIYAYSGGDEGAYDKSYTDLRKKNARTFSFENEADVEKTIFENTSTVELTKTFDENMSNYRIYGNSVQDSTKGTPSPTNPVEIQSVGDSKNIIDINNNVEYNTVCNVNDIYLDAGTYYFSTNAHTVSNLNFGIGITTTDKYNFVGVIKLISALAKNTEEGSFTISESGTYRLLIRTNNAEDMNTLRSVWNNVWYQIEKGENKTEYEPYGKYSIPIKLTGKNVSGDQINNTVKIYIDEPLRKVGEGADYIDYKNGKIVRKIGVIESYDGKIVLTEYISDTGELSIGATVYYELLEGEQYEEEITLPQLKTFEDYTKIEVLTDIAPSKIEVEYEGYTLD